MRGLTMDRIGFCLAFGLPLVACGGETDGARGAEEAAAPAEEVATETAPAGGTGYTVVEVTDGGTISGAVRFVGTVPSAQTVSVSEDAETCGESRRVQTVEVGVGQGLANAVVSLVDITRGAALETPASPPVLDQRGCRFVPHVLLAPAGAPVHILNNDPLTHNVHTVAFENRPVNRAQPKDLHQIEVTFRAAEKVKVKCDIHGWMSAWIAVVDHPYHAITAQNGAFVIGNVPPGRYTLEVWHETLGTSTQSVTVAAGETADVSVELGQD